MNFLSIVYLEVIGVHLILGSCGYSWLHSVYHKYCKQLINIVSLKMRYSPYVNKGFVYISVSKTLNFIRQLFIFS